MLLALIIFLDCLNAWFSFLFELSNQDANAKFLFTRQQKKGSREKVKSNFHSSLWTFSHQISNNTRSKPVEPVWLQFGFAGAAPPTEVIQAPRRPSRQRGRRRGVAHPRGLGVQHRGAQRNLQRRPLRRLQRVRPQVSRAGGHPGGHSQWALRCTTAPHALTKSLTQSHFVAWKRSYPENYCFFLAFVFKL